MRWLRAIKALCLATSLGLYPALVLQLLGLCWVSFDEQGWVNSRERQGVSGKQRIHSVKQIGRRM
jgi:hypothetical protein